MAKWVSAAHEIHRTKAELLKWSRPGAEAWVAALLKLNGSHTANLGVFWEFYMNIRWLEKVSPSQLRQGSLCRISPTLGSVLLLNICTFGHFFHLKQSAPAKGLFKSRGTEEARHSWTWVWIQKCILLSDHLIINEKNPKLVSYFPRWQQRSSELRLLKSFLPARCLGGAQSAISIKILIFACVTVANSETVMMKLVINDKHILPNKQWVDSHKRCWVRPRELLADRFRIHRWKDHRPAMRKLIMPIVQT